MKCLPIEYAGMTSGPNPHNRGGFGESDVAERNETSENMLKNSDND